jgi:hypothetical protein
VLLRVHTSDVLRHGFMCPARCIVPIDECHA